MDGNTMKYLRQKKWYKRILRSRRRRINQIQLGANKKKNRFWKIKIKLKLSSKAKKFFGWLRDSYVNMMLGCARSQMITSGYGGPTEEATGRFGARPTKEYDQQMLIDIYKSILMEREARLRLRKSNVPATTTRFGPITELATIAE